MDDFVDLIASPEDYMKTLVKIKTKDNRVINLELNFAQKKLINVLKQQKLEGKPQRVVILKARQLGLSTVAINYGYWYTTTNFNVNMAIVTHEGKATKELFERLKFTHNNIPKELRATEKYSNAKELVFESGDIENSLNSKINVFTAGGKEIGRSATNHYLLLSEFAFWDDSKAADNYTAIMQTVPDGADTCVIIECTANGFNHFKKLWDNAVAGENNYYPLFIAWFENPLYSIDCKELPNKTDDEKELQSLYTLSDSQLMWRRWCINNNCDKDLEKFKQEYPSNPNEAFITTGTPIFNVPKIISRIEELKQRTWQPEVGEMTVKWNSPDYKDFIKEYEFKERNNGRLRIYQKPIPGRYYCIGSDVAGEGSDKFTIVVKDNETGIQVAVFDGKVTPGEFIEILFAIGMWYNEAIIAIEINFDRYICERLEELKYPHLYVRKVYDTYLKGYKEAYGWKTDSVTRPMIVSRQRDILDNYLDKFEDIPMLQECITFVKSKKGRPDHLEGCHDDILFADMICESTREQQFTNKDQEEEKYDVNKLPEDYQEDYYSLDTEEEKNIFKIKMIDYGYWGKK